MNSLAKRKAALVGGGIALVGLLTFADPVADIRITHDVSTPAISTIEAKLDIGLVAISFLHSWKRVLR